MRCCKPEAICCALISCDVDVAFLHKDHQTKYVDLYQVKVASYKSMSVEVDGRGKKPTSRRPPFVGMRRGDVVTFPLLPTAVSVCAVCEKPRWRARGDLIVFPLSLYPPHLPILNRLPVAVAAAPPPPLRRIKNNSPRQRQGRGRACLPTQRKRFARQKRLRGQTIESRLQQVIVIAANKQTPRRTSTSSSTSCPGAKTALLCLLQFQSSRSSSDMNMNRRSAKCEQGRAEGW